MISPMDFDIVLDDLRDLRARVAALEQTVAQLKPTEARLQPGTVADKQQEPLT